MLNEALIKMLTPMLKELVGVTPDQFMSGIAQFKDAGERLFSTLARIENRMANIEQMQAEILHGHKHTTAGLIANGSIGGDTAAGTAAADRIG